MTTSDKIRGLMEERGLTQQQLAGLVGIHYITLNKNLKNNNFSLRSIQKIAHALSLSPSDLLSKNMADEGVLAEVSGYLEYKGEIVKIDSLQAIKQFVNKIETINNRQKQTSRGMPSKLLFWTLT